MENYKNSDNSGVKAFEIGHDFIYVVFGKGEVYKYSYKRPGPGQVEKMKRLARKGEGLATYISRQIRSNFESKLNQ